MPKEVRKRLSTHKSSPKASKPDIKLAKVSKPDTGLDVLAGSQDPQHTTKKGKQQLKREAFAERIGSASTPYSKSHNRRVKRKSKEELAGGGFSEVQAVIDSLGKDDFDEEEAEPAVPTNGKAAFVKKKSGQIGPGKAHTLSKAQRKRALDLESQRMPLILANPAFSTNPFATIRTHAQNSLIKHQPPS